ncbi:MAG: Brp/Blh family beta-carotene 15,15'-dioxygenase [Candidatus Sericytochromatia bacterium]|nr:Brp/Blh family beta-carotene 15,15'-dioxygenase [Candidatus Sericytochromatia bacterium]
MNYINSKWFKVQIIFQIIFIGLFLLFGFSANYQLIFALTLLCIVGIPHGANDHIYINDKTKIGILKFLAYYLGISFLYIILWYLMPLLALILFFIISFHHFGQSNFENDKIWYLPSILWGIILLAFPVILHFKEAILIFKSMIGIGDFNQLIYQVTIIKLEIWQISSIFILSSVYLYFIYKNKKEYFFDYLLQLILITVWYVMTPLLFGFIVIFCLWHSLQSIRYQTIYFKYYIKKSNFYFFKEILPFSLIALSGFAIYTQFLPFKIAQSFILLSLITLPHVIMMNSLYKKNITRFKSNIPLN